MGNEQALREAFEKWFIEWSNLPMSLLVYRPTSETTFEAGWRAALAASEPRQAGETNAPNGVLIVYPYGGTCKFCGAVVSAYSGHFCLAEPATPKPPEGGAK